MLNYEITAEAVARSTFWALLIPLLAGFAWSCGCWLWGRIVRP